MDLKCWKNKIKNEQDSFDVRSIVNLLFSLFQGIYALGVIFFLKQLPTGDIEFCLL